MSLEKRVVPENARLLWAFGRPYQFHWVTVYDPENPNVVQSLGANDYPNRKLYQKKQILLHSTASNNQATASMNYFQTGKDDDTGLEKTNGSHIVLERTPARSRGRNPYRASRAAVGLLHPDAVLDSDPKFTDVVLLDDLNAWISHGSFGNQASIGIEHHNVIDTWKNAKEESMQKNPRRPADENRYHRLDSSLCKKLGWGYSKKTKSYGPIDFQAFEDEQYNSMILMLRTISMEQRIPRLFLGHDFIEKAKRYAQGKMPGASKADRRERKSQFENFRGIIRHSNTHKSKSCPGFIAYNRLYRGLIDEWWMPLELQGEERGYYSGPFWNPNFAMPDNGGKGTEAAWFRWLSNPPRVESSTYRDADSEALTETRSHFDLQRVDDYYRACESARGGSFPISVSRTWHGGVHLAPDPKNPWVYAAASGTVVAARLSSNEETEKAPGGGSQRFVLIRHAVHWQREEDADGPPGGSIDPATGELDAKTWRLRYDMAGPMAGGTPPTYVFSLYMHLDPIPDLYDLHAENPRWYNRWLLDQAAALPAPHDPDKAPDAGRLDPIVGMRGTVGRVFNPDVEVSVGDVIGKVGSFADQADPSAQRSMLHFEILSHSDHEITASGERTAWDGDHDFVCDVKTIEKVLGEEKTPLAAAPKLRDYRVMHLSEWAWSREQLKASGVGDKQLDKIWPHLERFVWVADALTANPKLREQLGEGHFWHYHPITFMAAIQRILEGENRAIAESSTTDPSEKVVANVEVDAENFLSDFYDYRANRQPAWQREAADNRPIQLFLGSSYKFSRKDIACRQSSAVPRPAHSPNEATPTRTLFSLALLNVLQRIRMRFNKSLDIQSAYVCPAHTAELTRCCRGDAAHLKIHEEGVAVDFRASTASDRNLAGVRALWTEVQKVCEAFGESCEKGCGGDLPGGFMGVRAKAQSDLVTAALETGGSLSADEVDGFRVHLELERVP